jgi:hypothetical protein
LVLAAVPYMACRRSDHLIRLAGVDLSGLDLRGLNLAHADLSGANLRGCDLTDARLSDADLSGADLTDAVLRGVYADNATFIDAILVRADFRKSERDLYYGTHLMGANFDGADLTDACFVGAELGAARFAEARVRGADFRSARMDARTELNGAGFDVGALDGVEWAETPAAEDGDRVTVGARMPMFPSPVDGAFTTPPPTQADQLLRAVGRLPRVESCAA